MKKRYGIAQQLGYMLWVRLWDQLGYQFNDKDFILQIKNVAGHELKPMFIGQIKRQAFKGVGK